MVPLAVLATLVAGATFAPGATSAAQDWNLSGTWTSPLPTEHSGTSLTLTQSGSTITWQGGPNDRAWIQEFNGTLSGDSITGTFQQDAPGVSPKRYHGTMTIHVRDKCHFEFTSIVQAGMPTVTGVEFTKAGCTTVETVAYTWSAHFQRADGDLVTLVKGAGRFQETAGTIGPGSVGRLTIRFTNRKRPADNAVWTIKLTGRGRHRAAEGRDRGYTEFRASVSANPRSSCPKWRVGRLGLDHGSAIVLHTLCGPTRRISMSLFGAGRFLNHVTVEAVK
jgi:hypothetical protein